MGQSNSLAVMTYPSHQDGPDKTPVRFRVGLSFFEKSGMIYLALCTQYHEYMPSKSNSLAVMTYPSHQDDPDKTPVRFRVGLVFIFGYDLKYFCFRSQIFFQL